jgi:hypothetical protein
MLAIFAFWLAESSHDTASNFLRPFCATATHRRPRSARWGERPGHTQTCGQDYTPAAEPAHPAREVARRRDGSQRSIPNLTDGHAQRVLRLTNIAFMAVWPQSSPAGKAFNDKTLQLPACRYACSAGARAADASEPTLTCRVAVALPLPLLAMNYRRGSSVRRLSSSSSDLQNTADALTNKLRMTI